MTENGISANAVPARVSQYHPATWDGPALPAPTVPKSSFERPLSAIRRYRWLIIGVIALSVVGGAVAIRYVKPQYEVRATIWIEPSTQQSDASGPIRSRGLLSSTAWVELLRSYRIVDAVVRKLALYVHAENPGDQWIFTSFAVAQRYVPGKYLLKIDRTAKRWYLMLDNGALPESGALADSVGRRAGLRWVIPTVVFAGSGMRNVDFTVSTPREAAIDLMKSLDASLPEKSNFLWLRLRDENPQLAQRTLNTWLKEYIAVAGQLKKRNLVEFDSILRGQLVYAETSLRDAESALQSFRVNAITLPSEGGPIRPGIAMDNSDPALRSFFSEKIGYDELRNDREALEKIMAGAKAGTVPQEAALLIPSVIQSPGAQALRDAFAQLRTRQIDLAAKREILTDQHPTVKDLLASIQTLQNQTIPQLELQQIAQWKEREGQFDRRITSAAKELQTIPTRTTEEMRLRRGLSVSEALYTTLKSRAAEAQLAEASATPDVTVLDSAVAPLRPTRNQAPIVFVIAILIGLGAAIALAMLLDSLDPKLRYPEQVTKELGLSIAGAIPAFPKGGVNGKSPEQVSQLIESIRSVRMHIQHAAGTPVSLAVTSPSPDDGKSFVAANLAMSFSDAGFHTVLVDADTRRGILHEMFELPMGPGLTEFLCEASDIALVIRKTKHEKLSIVSSGKRRRRSPEMLTSPALAAFASELRRRYEVVVFDTPPLSAGIDAYAVSAAAQDMILVLRVGKTERRMASAKLEVMDRLPVRVL
ncbi:MAG TPA: polysaccharide biosynthesis tyrosine autokinase, partial [Gemmatimonadaceae bacterium]